MRGERRCSAATTLSSAAHQPSSIRVRDIPWPKVTPEDSAKVWGLTLLESRRRVSESRAFRLIIARISRRPALKNVRASRLRGHHFVHGNSGGRSPRRVERGELVRRGRGGDVRRCVPAKCSDRRDLIRRRGPESTSEAGFRIHGTAKILLGFSPAFLGQFGGNIRFVFRWDFRCEMPRLFKAYIPGDKALRAWRNLLCRISVGSGQLAKRTLAVRIPRLGAFVLLGQILGVLLQSGFPNAVDPFPVNFDLISCGCFHGGWMDFEKQTIGRGWEGSPGRAPPAACKRAAESAGDHGRPQAAARPPRALEFSGPKAGPARRPRPARVRCSDSSPNSGYAARLGVRRAAREQTEPAKWFLTWYILSR